MSLLSMLLLPNSTDDVKMRPFCPSSQDLRKRVKIIIDKSLVLPIEVTILNHIPIIEESGDIPRIVSEISKVWRNFFKEIHSVLQANCSHPVDIETCRVKTQSLFEGLRFLSKLFQIMILEIAQAVKSKSEALPR